MSCVSCALKARPGRSWVESASAIETENLVPAGKDLCDARFRMTTNAKEDGLGEDRSGAFVLGIPPSVTIAKTPVNQMSSPNQLVEWTIPVTNNGLCNLQTVTVSDVLDPGLSFESSVPPPSSVPDPQHQVPVLQVEPLSQALLVLLEGGIGHGFFSLGYMGSEKKQVLNSLSVS